MAPMDYGNARAGRIPSTMEATGGNARSEWAKGGAVSALTDAASPPPGTGRGGVEDSRRGTRVGLQRRWRLVAVLASVGLVAAACGGGSKKNNTLNTTTTTEVQSSASTVPG